MGKHYYVYILASKWDHVIYAGVTSDLKRRVWQHRTGSVDGFTKRYRVHHLVHFEILADPYNAINREKQIKSWSRARKNRLIESHNPQWRDLFDDI